MYVFSSCAAVYAHGVCRSKLEDTFKGHLSGAVSVFHLEDKVFHWPGIHQVG